MNDSREDRRRADEFLEWLDDRAGADASFQVLRESDAHCASVWYSDVPQAGSVFACTLGLSLAPYAAGEAREVLLRMDDEEPAWAWAVAVLVAQLRDRGATFAVGDTYNFNAQIAESSPMSAFVIGEQTVLSPDDTSVTLSDGMRISLVQAYPLHHDELVAFRNLAGDTPADVVDRYVETLGDAAFDPARPVRTPQALGLADDPREMVRDVPWPFDGDEFPANLGAIVAKTVASGAMPALQVVHFPDNSWAVADGVNDPNDDGALVVKHMAHVLAADPSTAELTSLPPGHVADRAGPDEAWTVSVFDYESE